jgi:uncharacterized protein
MRPRHGRSPEGAGAHGHAVRVLVAGASGFIGRAAVDRLLADGHGVIALSRDPPRHRWPSGVVPVRWDARSLPPVDGPVDAVVHLAGESVGQRWTAKVQERLRESRVGVAERLVEWIAARGPGERPSAYVAASAVGYYGLAPGGPRAEEAPPGDDALARLCRDWEEAGRRAEALGVRTAFLRFGVVLHPGGGALRRLLLPFRMGLGGPIGAGTQPFAWVHRDDAAAAVAWAVADGRARGDGFRFRHPDLSPALHEMLGR